MLLNKTDTCLGGHDRRGRLSDFLGKIASYGRPKTSRNVRTSPLKNVFLGRIVGVQKHYLLTSYPGSILPPSNDRNVNHQIFLDFTCVSVPVSWESDSSHPIVQCL